MFKKLMALLIFACLLVGCTPPLVTETAPPTETAAEVGETTAATAESVVVYVPEDVELEAVNTHSFRKSKETPAVAILDYRTAAFLTGEYPNNDFTRKCTRIQLVDLHTDTLICETLLEGTYTPLLRCAAEGYLAIAAENGEVLVFDKSLRKVLSFRTEDEKGILTADLGTYYYLWGSELRYLDVDAGESRLVSTEFDLVFQEILGYDDRENILLLSAYAGNYAAQLCVVAVDLDTKEYALLYRGVTDGAMAENGVLLELEHTEESCADLHYGDWTDTQMQILPGFLVNDPDFAAWHIPGSDYVCRFTYDKTTKIDIVEFELFRLGQTVTVASLQEEFDGAKITHLFSLPDGNLLAMEVSGRGYRTYLICPEQLEFTETAPEMTQGAALVDLSIIEEESQQTPWEMPESLLNVRQQADELEDKYGVTILISGQCTDALKPSEMTIITTDMAGLRNEAEAIGDALDDLDNMLSLYPEDFFRQFQDEAGERGLLVLLVEDFVGEMNIIGLSYGMGRWYPIAVDITSGEVASTFCHEIWHATENRIQDLNETALDLAAWENCNPAGYRYSGNMTPSYVSDTANTYLSGGAGEDVYFVDAYAKVNAKEDRARLMEYVMYTELDAKMMLQHPAMAAKLQILCDAIRQAFDTENWENVHWERFY